MDNDIDGLSTIIPFYGKCIWYATFSNTEYDYVSDRFQSHSVMETEIDFRVTSGGVKNVIFFMGEILIPFKNVQLLDSKMSTFQINATSSN